MLSKPQNRMYLAWVVALVAMLGSLYFSDIKGFRPCILCWYQRIAMYPLALLLGIATFKNDWSIRTYALPLAVIGWLIALFHNAEDWGWVKPPQACLASSDPTVVACDTHWPLFTQVSLLTLNDIITIPVLSMIAFTLIIALLWAKPKVLPIADTAEQPQ